MGTVISRDSFSFQKTSKGVNCIFQNSYVIITDVDFSNLGTCSYSISNDRIKFKGVRINNSLQHKNDLIFTFLKVSN